MPFYQHKGFLDVPSRCCSNRNLCGVEIVRRWGSPERRTMRSANGLKALGALCLAFSMIAIPASLAGAAQNPPSVSPSPTVIECPTSGQAYEIISSSITAEGVGTIFEAQNVGSNNVNFTLTRSITGSYTGSTTGTASVNVGFLFTSIDAQLSVTLATTKTSSWSTTSAATVPPGDWGIIQSTVNIVSTAGTLGNYEGGAVGSNGQCPLADQQSVLTSYPESGYVSYDITGTATSSTPPWPQA